MANYTGQSGVLKLDNYAGTVTSIAEVRSFSIEHTVNTVEDTVMGDQYKTYKTNLNEWSGSADIYLNDADLTAFGNVLIGDTAGARSLGQELRIEAFPGGNTVGFPKVSGNIIATGFSISSSMDGMVEASISFSGTGNLTLGSATA
jgi:hypothetical protein